MFPEHERSLATGAPFCAFSSKDKVILESKEAL